MYNLEDLLKMKIKGESPVTGEDIEYSPDFRLAVQDEKAGGTHIIVHPYGHDGNTLDFIVRGNNLEQINT